MTAQHTGGDWTLEPIPDSPHLAIMSIVPPEPDEDPKKFREVEIATVVFQDDFDEANANGRLLVKAREMYEALTWLLAELEKHGFNSSHTVNGYALLREIDGTDPK